MRVKDREQVNNKALGTFAPGQDSLSSKTFKPGTEFTTEHFASQLERDLDKLDDARRLKNLSQKYDDFKEKLEADFAANAAESLNPVDQTPEEKPKLASDTVADFFESKGPLKPLGQLIRSLSKSDSAVRKFMGSYANMLTFATNLSAQVLGESHPLMKPIGNLAYRSFVFMNGLMTTVNGLAKNRGIFTSGHAADMAIAFAPLDIMYQLRGFSVGQYNLDNALHKSSKDAPGGVYKNIGHSLKVSLSRLAEFPVELIKDVSRIFGEQGTSLKEKVSKFMKESLFSTEKATMGIIGGLAAINGAILNVLGFKTAGKISRDLIGAVAVDAERFNIQNLREGKLFYWLAGALFSGGTLSDMTKNTRMQIVFDSLAKMAATEMNRRGELDKDVHNEPIPIPWENPIGFMQATGKAVAEMFVARSSATAPQASAVSEEVKEMPLEAQKPLLAPIAPVLKEAVSTLATERKRSYADRDSSYLDSIYDDYDYVKSQPKAAQPVPVKVVEEPPVVEEETPVDEKPQVEEEKLPLNGVSPIVEETVVYPNYRVINTSYTEPVDPSAWNGKSKIVASEDYSKDFDDYFGTESVDRPKSETINYSPVTSTVSEQLGKSFKSDQEKNLSGPKVI
ncbi:MAG: hypothetical protein HRT47_11375 [Candidatus Caenarcaniphilales bacterium]|nr:hypothetical protein [Candidatus Caenarcaniphilales bacterium]